MKKHNEIDIVTNNELISFKTFFERLLELHRDCNREVYFSEIFMPFFRMCSTENMKIVPIFDDRACGPKPKDQTKNQQRMNIISAKKENSKYVVPDYIYVPLDYSFNKPLEPTLMIETKSPIILLENGKYYYKDLEGLIKNNNNQLKAEIESCGYVIFTDGITWMFLEMKDGEIIESVDYPTIRLVNQFEPYHKTNRILKKTETKKIDLSCIGEGVCEVEAEPQEWETLKQRVNELLTHISSQK